MLNKIIRTRFAPSPSGIIHLGNLRSALISFLCAKESNGTFILRIEDTDATRTQDCFLTIIYNILNIMKLYPDEGPCQSGPFAPYIQSERNKIYDIYLNILKEKNLIYRCFKTPEELDIIKNKQIALKLPPRYQRTILSEHEELQYLIEQKPYVWRLSLPNTTTTIEDKVKGTITYHLNNFSDCPITRQDHSYTFLFANFIDDVEMQINYVIRGEEHLSNTAVQAYLYDALSLSKPIFYHLPLICDHQGKKLSKRNFGFNIIDLLEQGYLPEAILNYIAIIGSSFKNEIMSLDDMIEEKIFTKTKSSGFITYDQEKLLWINTKWMQKISVSNFIVHLTEYKKNNANIIIPDSNELINDIKKETKTIKDFCSIITAINDTTNTVMFSVNDKNHIIFITALIIQNNEDSIDIKIIKEKIKKYCSIENITEKHIYNIIRKIIIRDSEGISISILLTHIRKEIILKKINIIVYE